jgi:FG-GAP-like repeat/Putative Ig domain
MKVSCRMLQEVTQRRPAVSTERPSHRQLFPILVLLGMLPILAPSGLAQAPLNFSNNFFVTGDYVVAGAYGLNTNFTTINGAAYSTGVISVPDPNPGITGTKQVPKGAQIVAALLYWQTIEKSGVAGGASGSGQNGYIRPLLYSLSGGPAAPGYAFSGTSLGSSTVSWAPGGCSGSSTGKVLRTYRADVAGAFPLDANGNPTANGSFEVRLPSALLSPPFTLGATLVVIYRILSGAGGPNIPLNSIVIYDGNYAPAKAQLTTTQQVQGFYDAAQNPVSRVTHIVGNGGTGYQTVYLNSTALPSLYTKLLPSFPGYYGNWDNPTWTFPSAITPSNPIAAGSGSATTQVVPLSPYQGCNSWGAVIVSTTVQNSDNDGILDSWKKNQGYCDAAYNNGICSGPGDPAWVPLSGATPGEQDVFLQYDYMCSSISSGSCVSGGGNYSFDPRLAVDVQDGLTPHATAVDKVVASYANHNIHLHAIPGNAIEENQPPNISCIATDATCPFPNEPGTVGFREGLAYIKNQTIDTETGMLGCDPTTDPNPCLAVFEHGKKDSYHYALYSHGVGLPSLFLSDGSLTKVVQSANTVTFTTKLPHGIAPIANDSLCASPTYFGRVTIVFAITNPNLNGTYCVTSETATTFTITVGGSATNFAYTSKTDPNLGVANGQVTSMSGYSDVGGQNSVVSLGYGGWGPPNNAAADGNKWQMKAGTLMHEVGHTMGLTHGGTFLNNLPNNANDYTPTFEANCKSNVQSSMSYLFQFDLLGVPNQLNAAGQPLQVVDYSEDPPPQSPQLIPTLTKSLPEGPGILNNLSYTTTASFQLTSYTGGNNSVSPHCDGSPLLPTDRPVTYVQSSRAGFFWSNATGLDINFDGNTTDVLHPHNEWEGTPAVNGVGPSPGLDLKQVSAVGTITAIGPGGEGGGLKPGGGGGGLKPGGGGGGLQPAGGGGGLKPAGGGGGLKPAGGGGLSAEITHQEANSYARPPQDLTIVQEQASPRFIDLSWFAPTFGTVVNYNLYQSVAGGAFSLHASVPGSQTTFQDTVTCNEGGYSYRVTAVTLNDLGQPQESVPSNTVPGTGQNPVTGCYTGATAATPPTVAASLAFNPATAVVGANVSITWSLSDDFYPTGGPVSRTAAAAALIAIGPIPSDPTCATAAQPPVYLNYPQTHGGSPYPQAASVLSLSGSGVTATNPFQFSWNTTGFAAGCYFFELDTDSVQYQQTTSAFELLIFESGPTIITTTLPNGVAGTPYNSMLSERGGTGALTWAVTSGSLPSGIMLNSTTGALSGIPTAAGIYKFTVTVTDSEGNFGTQSFTVTVTTPVAQINQPLVPGTSLPGGAGFTLTLNGTGFSPGSMVLWNGSSRSTTFNSGQQLTAQISASDVASLGTASILVSNPVTIFNEAVPRSNVELFQIMNPTATVSLSQTIDKTGANPNAVITADFNGDGKTDLAVANGDGTVSILLGNGDGTFITETPLNVGASATSLTAGDFNGDGKLDLAVASSGIPGSISIFLGNGDGTFQAPAPYAVGNAPTSVVTGDFNRDGKLDLAIANSIDHTVSILLGNGDGTFRTQVPYAAGVTDVAAVALGDFNGDNELDLAVTNPTDGTVSILLGNGDGTFQTPVAYTPGTASTDQPTAVAAVDLNGDGKLDLAVTNLNAKTVGILLGNGNGTFQPTVTYPTTSGALTGPGAITAGDFNADNKVDLAITNQANNTVAILLGNGDGTFQSPSESTTGNFAAGVAAGDFNGDGRLDVAVANTTDGTVAVMLQRPQPPTNLATTSVTASSVSLSWTASISTDVVSYNVYRGTTPGGPYSNIGSVSSTQNTFTDSTVSSGPTYYYVVAAVIANNLESANSNEVSATPTTALAAPTNVSGSAPFGEPSISWTASISANVVSYNVYRATSSTGPFTLVGTTTTTSFLDGSAQGAAACGGTTFYYVVTTVGAGNAESAFSNPTNGITVQGSC